MLVLCTLRFCSALDPLAHFPVFVFRYFQSVTVLSGFPLNALKVLVASSGMTDDGFHTYEFDYFTDVLRISPLFTSAGESISISEVSEKQYLDDIDHSFVLVKGYSCGHVQEV